MVAAMCNTGDRVPPAACTPKLRPKARKDTTDGRKHPMVAAPDVLAAVTNVAISEIVSTVFRLLLSNHFAPHQKTKTLSLSSSMLLVATLAGYLTPRPAHRAPWGRTDVFVNDSITGSKKMAGEGTGLPRE